MHDGEPRAFAILFLHGTQTDKLKAAIVIRECNHIVERGGVVGEQRVLNLCKLLLLWLSLSF